jgi:hypothetical protein
MIGEVRGPVPQHSQKDPAGEVSQSELRAHTPGPWVFDYSSVYSNAPVTGNIICLCPPDRYIHSHFNWDANARLIAAAPKMLAALMDLLVIAEQHIIDLCADAQEGREPDAVWKMEMARWSAVGDAVMQATGREP